MKRALCILLAAAMLLGAVGCANSRKDWQEQYDLGMRYLSEGNYEEAILAFSAAIEIDSSRPEAYMGRADAYKASGDLEAALKDYERARKRARESDEYEDLLEELEEILEELEEIVEEAEGGTDGETPPKPVKLLSCVEVYDDNGLSFSYRFTYDAQGAMTQVQYNEYAYGYGTTYIYTYDEQGRVVYLAKGEYAYDEYAYDSEGRLIRYYSVEGGAVETTYEYDDQGRLIREYSVDIGDEEILYTYDDRGLRTGATISYTDWYGDELHSGTVTYEYDAQNRLAVEIMDKDTYSQRTEYSYYENAVIANSAYSEGYGWANVRIGDGTGADRWTLYIYHPVASVEVEDGYITGITDNGGYVYRFTYTEPEEETQEETVPEKPLGLTKPLDYEILMEDRSYYDADGVMRIQRYYKKAVIEGERPAFAAINAAIEADMEGFFSILDGEDLSYYISFLSGSEYLFHTADMEVTDNSGVVFSCRISTAWYMGGVFNADFYGLSFDAATGEPVDLPALFGVSEAEMTRMMQDAVWAYLSANHAGELWENVEEIIYGYALADFFYYFQDGELIVTFPTYAIACGAAGAYIVPTGLYY